MVATRKEARKAFSTPFGCTFTPNQAGCGAKQATHNLCDPPAHTHIDTNKHSFCGLRNGIIIMMTSSSVATGLVAFLTLVSVLLVPVNADDTLDGTGPDLYIAIEKDGSARLLQNKKCPKGYKIESGYYNALFDVYTDRKTDCNDGQLRYIGKDFQRALDREFKRESDGTYDEDFEVLKSKTEVCQRIEKFDNQRFRRHLMFSTDQDGQDHNDDNMTEWDSHEEQDDMEMDDETLLELFGNEVGGINDMDEEHRKLSVLGFRMYLYRSQGRCYFCSADDWDDRRELFSKDILKGKFNNFHNNLPGNLGNGLIGQMVDLFLEAFAEVVQEVQNRLDPILTNRVKRFTKRSRHCLHKARVDVKSTIAIKTEKGETSCDDVYCCAHEVNQQVCFFQSDVAAFCHTSKEICETNCGGGVWINSKDPPTCLSFHQKCERNKNGDDNCCPGSVCHKYDGEPYKCIPEVDLASGNRSSPGSSSVSVSTNDGTPAVAIAQYAKPPGQCSDKRSVCVEDDDCCSGKCENGWVWKACA